MFNIGLTITPNDDPSVITLLDASTTDETVISRSATVTKTDLSVAINPFPTGVNTINIGGFDKDYALAIDYTVVTNVNTYTKKVKFVLLGYARKGKTDRIKYYEVEHHQIIDRDEYKKDTLNINYYMMVANDRVAFSDMLGAQKALDFIADIIFKDSIPNQCT